MVLHTFLSHGQIANRMLLAAIFRQRLKHTSCHLANSIWATKGAVVNVLM